MDVPVSFRVLVGQLAGWLVGWVGGLVGYGTSAQSSPLHNQSTRTSDLLHATLKQKTACL